MKRLLFFAPLALAVIPAPRLLHAQERGAGTLSAPSTRAPGANALGEALAGLPVSARVLLIGAHPDDEDNRLVAWMSRGRHYDFAYLSLTRGDGGQNAIGNELGEALGAIRTEELLAARRVDGAAQYFTRAYDFGFSKSADEAFRHWPHDTLLGDVVKVVRAFRPHVIIAVFSGTPQDGHGHHQASGILAREAFDAAADTVRYPAARFGAAWTPLKFYRNRSYWGNEGATFRFNGGEYSPLLGMSYAELAAIGRAEHRSQAQGNLRPRGPVTGSLRREATRVDQAPEAAAERAITDGFDPTYARLHARLGCARANAAVDSLDGAFVQLQRATDLENPSGAVQPLARIATLLDRVPAGSEGDCATRDADAAVSIATLRARVDDALRVASGVLVLADAPREEAIVGRAVPVRVTIYDRGATPLDLVSVQASGDELATADVAAGAVATIAPDSAVTRELTVQPTALSQPYWLAEPRLGDLYAAARPTPASAGRPAVTVTLRAPGGGDFRVRAPIAWRHADQVRGEESRPLAAVPAVSVTTDDAVQYARAGVPLERAVDVTLRSADTAARDVRVALQLPAGLVADSAARTVTLGGYGATRTVRFSVRGRLPAGRHVIRAIATSNGERFARGYRLVDYEHIPPLRLYRDAEVRVQAIDVALPARTTIAYVQGVGDNSAAALRLLGFDVTMLDPEQLGTHSLGRYAAVVIGPRAYEASPALVRQNATLLDYVKRGGTLVVQYGQQEMQNPGIMPYAVTVPRGAQRVTDEASEVRITDPSAPVLRWPNRITTADFAGWIQDRTLYMPATHAPEYAAPLSTNDPGEPPSDASLLVARYGQGTYVYTTLAFFRQLPAGVPGAARLFVNLIAAGAGGGSGGVVGGKR